MNISVTKTPSVLIQDLCNPAINNDILLWWLGQAGFALRFREYLILIDPYLSDSLAKKYAGTTYPHIRMMDIPISPEALKNVDLVLCTHAHTDHMDPETLQPVAGNNPNCTFIIPKAVTDTALARGIPKKSLVPAIAGHMFHPLNNIAITPVAAAHENLQTDGQGYHLFLGYVLKLGSVILYHSGDCIPYKNLPAMLKPMNIDIALLPVNGRDEDRRKNGILGNFHFHEAVQLCIECGISFLIPHHFGMFSFNTVDPSLLTRQAEKYNDKLQCFIPQMNYRYHFRYMD